MSTPPLKEIHVVLHTHTDIGFTHDQPIVWDLHGRFIEEALDRIERDAAAELPEEAAFKWTCEAWMPVWHWWRQTDAGNRRRFKKWIQAGRLEVTALPLHLAPLYDIALHAEIQAAMRVFEVETGCRLRSAMNCDVNGQHAFVGDLLLDAGVTGYSTAINVHFGHSPLEQPSIFRWETPSGRELPALVGFSYGTANRFLDPDGEATARLRDQRMPQLQAHLQEVCWPLPIVLLQGVHAFGDNGSAPSGFSETVARWNASGDMPRMRISTMGQWWKAVEPYLAQLPVHRGDWTDSWNFGAGSAAREMAVAKRAQARLQVADTLAAALPGYDERLAISRRRYRQAAGDALIHWTEHTWGADCGVGEPYSEDTDSLWNHKAHYAYQARSLANLLRRDALAALAAAIKPSLADKMAEADSLHFVVFNPLPFKRTISGMLPATLAPNPRGGIGDQTAGRLYAERRPDWDPLQSVGLSGAWLDQMPQYLLPPTELDGFGWKTLPARAMVKVADAARDVNALVLENHYLRIELDNQRGGLCSLRLHGDEHEWVDAMAPWSFGAYIRERIDPDKAKPVRQSIFAMDWSHTGLVYPSGWKPDWPTLLESTQSCRSTRVHQLPDGYHAIQEVELPGNRGILTLTVFLPQNQPWVEVSASWIQGMETDPEGHYFALPFGLNNPQVRIDLGGLHIDPERDQLPGVTHDFFTVGRWVDFHNGERGVTIATPENPLCQLGDFRFGRNHPRFELRQARFLGWIANNYWDTNFRAHQPGKLSARYRIHPYKGSFDADAAHMRGECAQHSQPQAHPIAGCDAAHAILPLQGQLLEITDAASGGPTGVRVVSLSLDAQGNPILRLFNDARTNRSVRINRPLHPDIPPLVIECHGRRLIEIPI